jgi:hypothetical protein
MNADLLDKIVNSVLYEGYMLYPYRRSSLKNRHRWNFGIVYPSGLAPQQTTTECLIETSTSVTLTIEVRFLQLREDDGWQEAIERKVVACGDGVHEFHFDDLQGDVRVAREPIRSGTQKIRVEITNRTPLDRHADSLLQSFVSTHAILNIAGGEFVSLLDPPDDLREATASCQNLGMWPVLVGKESERDCMLASPIILYDYPRVADESPSDLYDCTEIDEILTLRIQTLTETEKDEMRRSGERERRLLERVESLTSEQLSKLHGTMRNVRSGLKPGDRVRLKPRPGGDVFDLALAGRIAIVESIEQDFDNRTHIAVVIEDDPGKDLGLMRQPGHRFFFYDDEMELIA